MVLYELLQLQQWRCRQPANRMEPAPQPAAVARAWTRARVYAGSQPEIPSSSCRRRCLPFAAAAAHVAVALVLTVCCWRCCCGWIDSVHQIDNNNAHVSKIEFKYTYARGDPRVLQLSKVRGRLIYIHT